MGDGSCWECPDEKHDTPANRTHGTAHHSKWCPDCEHAARLAADARIAALEADCARISAEFGLPPGIAPADGEIRHMLELLRATRAREAGLVAELAESKRAHEQRDEIDACSNRRIVDREAERVELVAMLKRTARASRSVDPDTSSTGSGVAYDFALDDARALLARLKGGG